MIRYFVFFLFLFAADAATKVYALKFIPLLKSGGFPFGGVAVFQNFGGISFSLNTIFNTGAAWGVFADFPGALFALRLLIVLGFGFYFYFFRKCVLKTPALWLIAAGALGNALDYLLYGHVVDFLHFVLWGYSFPIFNLADSFITLGVFFLYFFSRFESRSLKDI